MDLWIRTQDRTTLIRSYEIYIIEQQNRCLIRAKRTSHILGSYDTYERALEVLNEIEERIMLINTINIVKDRDSLIAYKNALTEEKIKGLGYPYQMPKK